ncbi:phage tail protein [Photobacterium damselae subsp. damselae]|uniref:phage tail-collar fiber domain-containing protein n=1 Tax=Photobacterium damselae TaxID=38293 RepID=UPI001F3B2F96|nr:phage tail protein [Photobacterium damselae]UJZ95063.1 phage tail protein [Photobacterium damselae subsp. damselae]UJZ99044.1 phage tail protein [Photobacterium damselae subsp. damselae]
MTTVNKYYTIVTQAGFDKLQSYYNQDKTLKLTQMGFGGVQDVYIAPSMSLTTVPNEWVRLPLERHPNEGFIGGGATVSNQQVESQGHFVSNVGIYDEDGILILISALPQFEISSDSSVVSVYPIDIFTALDNAEHVQVVIDTSINHPTYDEFSAEIEKLSRYATTEEKGLIELATQQEVSDGTDNTRAVTPSTLKPQLDALSEYASTANKGLVELATQEEVNAGTDPQRVVTAETLDKPTLINQLQEFASQKAEDVKQFILGGVPSSSLDTILEIDKALQQTGDAIRSLYDTIATKLPALEFNTYKEWVQSQLNNKLGKTEKAVDADKLDGFQSDISANASTIPARDGSGDINARLFKSSYPDQNTIDGAIAFRVNNGADSYIRFCNSKAYIRQWLGLTQGNLKIETGVISDGQTIPMREQGGYNPRYMVSLADSGTEPWDVWEGGIYNNNVPYRTVCKVDGNGHVTAKRYVTYDKDGMRVTSCQANYLVMYYTMS